jgi:hypothetical protein
VYSRPYTPDDKVDSLTGIPGAAGQAHDIRSNDGINVLMFVDARIVASAAHARNQGDFGREVVGKCYSREQANFSRVPPANSWGNIGPGLGTAIKQPLSTAASTAGCTPRFEPTEQSLNNSLPNTSYQ